MSSPTRILILGAGVVGTTSAWYLAQAGYAVTVVDRQPGAGLETSFANGGQISVSHAEPWANPHVLPQIFRWLGREDAPLLFRWRLDPALFSWGISFLRECLPGRCRANIRAIVALALESRARLRVLREEQTLEYDALERGILHLYTERASLARGLETARLMSRFGLERHPMTPEECLALEPALAPARALLAGGDYTPSDESGDAHRFTQALAERCVAAGVIFNYGQSIEKITAADGKVTGVLIQGQAGSQRLSADAYVLALGSHSPRLAAPLGLRLPIYPAKGYSATLPLAEASGAPTVSLTDDAHKLVFSRLGKRLRIAGTAEFNGYNLDPNPVRTAALMARVRQLFPRLETCGEPEYWCGLRPATPSNLPLIGRSAFPNLWLNTGHGTLGWTLACGSGAALAELMRGRRPRVDFPFTG